MLRALGWRYSITRDAWVHSVLRGRIGPVFYEEEEPREHRDLEIDPLLAHCLAQAMSGPGTPAMGKFTNTLPDHGDQRRAVWFPIDAEQPPRIVIVDGRPPRIVPPAEDPPGRDRIIDVRDGAPAPATALTSA